VSRLSLRCTALAVAALAVVPATSMAGPLDIPAAVPPQFRALVRSRLHTPEPHSASESRFDLKTRQGYEVSVFGVGDVVAVEVIPSQDFASAHDGSPLHSAAVTAYVARGTVTPNRIEASFGDLGRIAVRFHPSGRISQSKPRRHCKGADRFTTRYGVFLGSVRFTGEDRYVSVHAHRAKGRIRTPRHLHCVSRHIRVPAKRDSRPVTGPSSFAPTILAALWRQALASTDFLSFQVDGRTLFLAVTEQSKGSMAEMRYALATAPSKDFVSDDALTSATVTPPPPFDGQGVYSAGPDGTKAWTGSLSASFPGAPRLPLTGPQFEVTLAAGF
jgi:hypothetical protein